MEWEVLRGSARSARSARKVLGKYYGGALQSAMECYGVLQSAMKLDLKWLCEVITHYVYCL